MSLADEMMKNNNINCELKNKLGVDITYNQEERKEITKDVVYANLDIEESTILEKMLDSQSRWSNGDKLIQTEFMEEYISMTNLKYINYDFYSINGYLGVDKLKQSVFNILSKANIRNLNSEIKNIVDLLKIKCFIDNYNLSEDKIYVKNGLITLNDKEHSFEPIRKFSTNLINANYTTNKKEPQKWLAFLNALLNAEDIDILQEYLGYCLIPTTYGQKCLFIVGKGGEGKSVIGKVLNSIFGNSMVSIKLQKLLTNKFSLAQLKDKLIIFEDELQDMPIQEIDTFKSLITGGLFSVEEKFQREQQASLYARFIVLGNNILKHKNCKEPSFQRRLLLLTTKEKDKNRVDNPYLPNELIEEKDLIFMWLLNGLERLLKNNYQFSHKEYMKKKIEEYYKNEYSIIVEAFIRDDKYIKLLNGAFSPTSDLTEQFEKYCLDNFIEYSKDKFTKELSLLQELFNIKKDRKYFKEFNKQIWGYTNIIVAN